jgi:hypothetical protein
MSLPTEAKARKAVPIFSGCIRYFPDALAAVARLSRIGNDQHNPGQPLHWDRSKSTDELDALMRHLVDCGTVDSDGVLHDTKVAWRALANLQKRLEDMNYDRRRDDHNPESHAGSLRPSTGHGQVELEPAGNGPAPYPAF